MRKLDNKKNVEVNILGEKVEINKDNATKIENLIINNINIEKSQNTPSNAISDTCLEFPCPNCKQMFSVIVSKIRGAEVFYVTQKEETCSSCGVVLEYPMMIRFFDGRFHFYH